MSGRGRFTEREVIDKMIAIVRIPPQIHRQRHRGHELCRHRVLHHQSGRFAETMNAVVFFSWAVR